MNGQAGNARRSSWFHDSELRTLEKAIRRVVRANDLRSRALVRRIGLTIPQAVVLKGVEALGEVTTTALSAHADLSAATVVTILDNLEERGLVERYRSRTDRRVVHARLTPRGHMLLNDTPEPFGEAFAARFAHLPSGKRRRIVESVVELADLLARESEEPADAGPRCAAGGPARRRSREA